MLAVLPQEYLEKYVLARPMQRMTEHTITTKQELLKELAEIRKSGVAMDREEIELGLTCVAAPILQHEGTVDLAVSISFPYGKAGDIDMEEVKQDLLACTQKISARLGYRC